MWLGPSLSNIQWVVHYPGATIYMLTTQNDTLGYRFLQTCSRARVLKLPDATIPFNAVSCVVVTPPTIIFSCFDFIAVILLLLEIVI